MRAPANAPHDGSLRALLARHTRADTLHASAVEEQRRSVRHVMTSGGYRFTEIDAEAGAGVHVIGPDRSELHGARSRESAGSLLANTSEPHLDLAALLNETLRGERRSPAVRVEVITDRSRRRIASLTGSTDERELSSVRLRVHVRIESKTRAFVARRSLRHPSPDVTAVVRGLVEQARDAATTFLDARPVPRGITDVVLANGSSGLFLHEVLGHCLEGDVLLTGQSIFSRKQGARIATRSWTVVDEPLDRAAVLDDEGQATQPVVMVEAGRLRASLLDRRTALRFGLASSHNGRLSSFREPPLPRMSRTTLLPGDVHPEEIVRGVKRGVYIERLGAAGVVVGTGDFTLVVSEARLIEDGRLTAPLSELTVVGNGPRQLLEASVVGSDTTETAGVWSCVKGGQSVDVAFGGPTLRLTNVVVRGGA